MRLHVRIRVILNYLTRLQLLWILAYLRLYLVSLLGLHGRLGLQSHLRMLVCNSLCLSLQLRCHRRLGLLLTNL